MSGTVAVLDFAIIPGTLIFVMDNDVNGGSRGLTMKDARENFCLVGFAPCCGEFALAWLSAV